MTWFPEHVRAQAKERKSKQFLRLTGHVPVETLGRMGCSGCPRDDGKGLRTPKMKPEGSEAPLIYLLNNRPSPEDDDAGYAFSDLAGREIESKVPRKMVRMGHIVQCGGTEATKWNKHSTEIETSCCKGRAVADIEQSKPLVIIGVGPEVLHWATGLNRHTAPFRGTLMPIRVGTHTCWFYPVNFPDYVNSKTPWKERPFELTMEHDMAYIEHLVKDRALGEPVVYDKPYDTGIELIEGNGHGDMVRLEDAFHWLASLSDPALDIEANGLRVHMTYEPKIWSAAMGTFDRTIAFSLQLPDGGWETETRMTKVMGLFGELLMQSGRKRCHNMAYEQEWLSWKFGTRILRRTEWDDTMAMGHAFDERKDIKALDIQTVVNFGFFLKDQSPVNVKLEKWWTQFSVKQILRYNGLDTKWTHKLADKHLAKLRASTYAMEVYQARRRLAPTLVLTTARGLPIDFEYAKLMIDETKAKLEAIERKGRNTIEIAKFTDKFGSFSFTNNDHVLKLYKETLPRTEIESKQTDAASKWSVDEEALKAMPPHEVPSAQLILDHRVLTRNLTTYLEPLINGKMTGPDGMLHSTYQSMVTVTGRLNSEIHNWPKHKHKEVRGVVTAPPGYWMVAADQGQIEFRVAGMLSQDENLVKYCWTGYDVHKYWAERVYGAYPEIVDWIVAEFEVDWDEKGIKTLRQVAKNNWVFPLLFGSEAESCATRMHIPKDIAIELAGEFWDEFPGVLQWQKKILKDYDRKLYVETMGGVRRRGPTTKNELINMPIQGTACEIVLGGMNALSEMADELDDWELQPGFNGHDDLSFIMHDRNLMPNIETIAYEMCKPRFDYVNVPLIVEVSIGSRWDKLEEIGKYSSEKLFNLRNPYN